MTSKITYTKTDEAPALATSSFLPIVQLFTSTAGIEIETKDISLAGRIISNFSKTLNDEQKTTNALNELGALAKTPDANIIKLPNISASVPQLKAAISELQSKGYNLPDYPENPQSKSDEENRAIYAKVLGSAVNPVLREGNSDRRVAGPVKEYAKRNPHSMGAWSSNSKSHVAHMKDGDFYSSEKSIILDRETNVSIKFISENNTTKTLKEKTPLLTGEIIDASVMNSDSLCQFFSEQIQDAKKNNLLLSLHLKATMMKVSDPIIFGLAVRTYFKSVFDKHSLILEKIGVNPCNGLNDLESKIQNLPETQREEIKDDLKKCYENGPDLAMVDSDKGITNLHVPSDIIIDASMPAAIRASGKMWGSDGKLHDTKAMIPDRSYAGVYQATIDFCKENGAFDPSTMGNVANVGLMAKKAEEYGSHDKTFCLQEKGVVRVIDDSGKTLLEHPVNKGDIWRMCQTKDEAIKDWIRLAINRAKSTKNPAIFWLDKNRAHDVNLIEKITSYLKVHDDVISTNNLEVQILSPFEACRVSLERMKKGQDTISVTGNVLRDYLTDLFPILELGTSAKMLSIVPLLSGGGLFETGAGGSAPKHVQQFLEEGHLRWDSLGEFLALAVSLEALGEKTNNEKALTLAKTLNKANGQYLSVNKSPSRKVGEIDNRGSHFYLTMYWAEALAEQNENIDLQEIFSSISKELKENEVTIVSELKQAQGCPVDLGGYYFPDEEKITRSMRPSETFNSILNR